MLGIKDEDQKFDMIVRNCVAHDGKRTPIQLVNEMGCVIRPKIMSKFNKIKNFGSSATVVSYAYFQVIIHMDSFIIIPYMIFVIHMTLDIHFLFT